MQKPLIGPEQVDWVMAVLIAALAIGAVVHLIADLKGVPLRRQRWWAAGYVPTLFAALLLLLGLPIVYALTVFVFGVLVAFGIFGSLAKLRDSQKEPEGDKD